MRLMPNRLLPAQQKSYYLHGEDGDAIFEAAEKLLKDGVPDAVRIRVDVNELARIEQESRNQGLFGPSICYAMVRNAQSANPKQSEHLLRLAANVADGNRLIICAAAIDWKKALHKKMKEQDHVGQCEFKSPNEMEFGRWLQHEIRQSGLNVEDDAIHWMSECLCGMRLAARQMIERLNWYDAGKGEVIGLDIVAELLGERAPGVLEEWCHAVAMRSPGAVKLANRLLADKQVAEVQMISWLGTRIQQLLMYLWHQGQGSRNPLQAAKVFGEARNKVSEEARAWTGGELSWAVNRIVEAEKLVKGASVEDKAIVIERLTLDLINRERRL